MTFMSGLAQAQEVAKAEVDPPRAERVADADPAPPRHVAKADPARRERVAEADLASREGVAEVPEAPDQVEEEEPEEHHNVVGTKGAVTRKMAVNETLTEWGAMAFYERSLIPRWLELEVGAGAFVTSDGKDASYPVEVLFKKPFELGHLATLYLAAGPTVIVEAEVKTRATPGYVTMMGAYLWPTDAFGFDTELAYGGLFEPAGYAHEVTFAMGPAVRF